MAKRIPPNKVDEIYAAADIVEVVGEYVTLKRRGSNHFGLSPWGNEKTPSFAVSQSKGIYKDFSSGKGGNAVSFLMELEGMSYVEALLHLAKKYNIHIEMDETPDDEIRDDHRESLYILNEFAAKFFHKILMEDEKGRAIALSYFKERGILESTMDEFQLGYSPESWDTLVKEALKNQFKEEFIEMTGLAFRSEKDGRLLDRFKGRIMFPIHNHLGKIAGFGGRIIGKHENTAKYINSPESVVYNKSRILYGLWQGRQAIREKNSCILAEGYMDVISLHQNGIRNAVASSGTALTEDQIRMIKRFTRNVMLIYDADKAGINAALRGVDLLLDNEMIVRVLLLPEGEDPDSFVQKQGKTGFENYLREHSSDFIDFKITQLLRLHNVREPQGKSTIIHETAETIAHISDAVQKAVYTEMAAAKIGIATDVMQAALQQAQKAKDKFDERNKRVRGIVTETPESLPVQAEVLAIPADKDQQEKELLRLMLNYHDKLLTFGEEEIKVLEYIYNEMEELKFSSPILEEFRRDLITQWQEKGAPDVHRLVNHAIKEIADLASHLVTIPVDEVSEKWLLFNIRVPKLDENLEHSVEDALDHFRLKKLHELLMEIKTIWNSKEKGSLTEAEENELIKKHLILNSMKVELAQKKGITFTTSAENIFDNTGEGGTQTQTVQEQLKAMEREEKFGKNKRKFD